MRITKAYPEDLTGSALQIHITCRFSELVKVFGKPEYFDEGCKQAVEWIGRLDGEPFCIYNYGDAKNYIGKRGLAIDDIQHWHIGGFKRNIADRVATYFLMKK